MQMGPGRGPEGPLYWSLPKLNRSYQGSVCRRLKPTPGFLPSSTPALKGGAIIFRAYGARAIVGCDIRIRPPSSREDQVSAPRLHLCIMGYR